MKHINELEKILSQILEWNKARLNCLAQILQALFFVRTVNLAQIAEAFQSSSKEESIYRRLQRFFQGFSFDMSCIVAFVLNLFEINGKFTLVMDRTNWKWGKRHINILMLSVEHFGIGIPIFWTILDSSGCSSTMNRKDLLKQVLHRFGSSRIEVLLADREFVGEAWFRFLIEENIPFIIRIQRNYLVDGLRPNYSVPIKELLKKLGKKRHLLNHLITLWGHPLYASIEYARKAKEPMIVVSNRLFGQAVKIYRKRWCIENLFECLKSRGFRLEDTHMTHPDKIEKLVFILALAFCWAYKTGAIMSRPIQTKIKTHGRKAKSSFRIGLGAIRSALIKGKEEIQEFLSLLTCFNYSELERCAI